MLALKWGEKVLGAYADTTEEGICVVSARPLLLESLDERDHVENQTQCVGIEVGREGAGCLCRYHRGGCYLSWPVE